MSTPPAPVLVVAYPGVETALLTAAGLATASILGEPGPAGRNGSISRFAAAQPDARFIFLAGEAHDPPPGELAELPAERWTRVDRPRLLADPRSEIQRLSAFAGVDYDQALLTPVEAAVREQRLREGTGAAHPSPFASQSTASFRELLSASGSSLLISTYQTNRLVCARAGSDELNTHFRFFDKPMGIAVGPGRIALGTRNEVWDLRNMPEAAGKVDPPGAHDACYLPRNRHLTGDIAIHDLAFAQGELWVVATAFSCLATLDADHSFIPRWSPPFISELAPEDRCHLNGLCVINDKLACVTALGMTDTAGGWREGKATGGVLIDVGTAEVAVGGLSMPHSPRFHQGRLWLLESGQGELCVVDLDAGRTETVAELPGFTRGLAFIEDYALVGLSQIRESSTFGDLPVTHRLSERQSGVWIVDLRTGQIAGLLRFEDLVQEIFDVAVLPGIRYPEIAEPAGPPTDNSYALP